MPTHIYIKLTGVAISAMKYAGSIYSSTESLNMNRNYAYFFRKKIKINELGIYNIISVVVTLSIGKYMNSCVY